MKRLDSDVFMCVIITPVRHVEDQLWSVEPCVHAFMIIIIIILSVLALCAHADDVVHIVFETSEGKRHVVDGGSLPGTIVVESDRSWSPRGHDFLMTMIIEGFFDIPNSFYYVRQRVSAQFGRHGNVSVRCCDDLPLLHPDRTLMGSSYDSR